MQQHEIRNFRDRNRVSIVLFRTTRKNGREVLMGEYGIQNVNVGFTLEILVCTRR